MRLTETLLCAAIVVGFVLVTASGRTSAAIRTLGEQTQNMPAEVMPTSVPDAAIVDVCRQAKAADVKFDPTFLKDCIRVHAFAPTTPHS